MKKMLTLAASAALWLAIATPTAVVTTAAGTTAAEARNHLYYTCLSGKQASDPRRCRENWGKRPPRR